MKQTVMSLIEDFVVPRNAVALWWFGQNGYIFKSPEGTLVSVDLYLSNHCAAEYSAQRPRFYAINRGQARLWRLFGRRLRIVERNAPQPDELAD